MTPPEAREPHSTRIDREADGDKLAGFELEFNPFSTASRAARAEREGRIADALHLYVEARQFGRVRDCLLCVLPTGPVRTILMNAAAEWPALHRGLLDARRPEQRDGWVNWFDDEVREAETVLWQSAERLADVLALDVDSPRIQQLIRTRTDKLNRLARVLREARAGLAEITLSGADIDAGLEKSECRLLRLVDAVRALKDIEDEAQA